MNSIGRKGVVVFTVLSLLLGGLGFGGAQNAQTGGTETQTLSDQPRQPRAFGRGMGFGGLPFGPHLALGTTVELVFYDGDPQAGGTELETLTFTYGEDSEVTFAQAFAEVQEGPAYLVTNVGEQVQTFNLADPTEMPGRGPGHRGLLPLHGLTEGSTVEATFYDGDPQADAQPLQTLTFRYGQDSEAGFAADYAAAAEGAAFVSITTSPQTYTVDLSAVSLGHHDESRGRDGFGKRGFGQGRFR